MRNLREAKLRLSQASLEDIDYSARRELDRAADPPARHLPLGRRAPERADHRRHRHGQDLRRLRPRAAGLSPRLPRRSIGAPRGCSTSSRSRAPTAPTPALLARLARVDVLVIDDFGLAPLDDQQRQDLLEVLDDRHGLRSTIVASQLPVAASGTPTSSDPTLADAICERLLHNAHRLVLKGPSRRKLEARPD